MKKKFFVSLLFLVLSVFTLVMFGCKGDTGPAGATGATGAPGTPGESIIATTFQKDFYPSPAYSGVIDSYIVSDSYENGNNGTATSLYIGFFKVTNPIILFGKQRPVIKFDLNYLSGQNIIVKNAKLILYVQNYYPSTLASIDVNVYKLINNQFTENGVTWMKYDGSNNWTTSGGDYDSVQISNKLIASSDIGKFVNFDLNPTVVQSWIDNPSDNYGMILISSKEDSTSSTFVDFASSNTGVVQYRPKLTVYYTLN